MQTIANAEQKVISQYITVYQSIISFSVEKLWLEVILKYNKSDTDNMLDDCNAHLIEVCEDYLKEHKLNLDKFQLATIVAQLWSQTISELNEPFRVTIKESKHLVQDYLEKNKAKRETLERIKKENEALDKEVALRKKEQQEKKVIFRPEPEMPSGNLEAGGQGSVPGGIKKQKKQRWTDALAIDNFYIPWIK